MKIARKLTVVTSLILAAGCSHHERQASNDNTQGTYSSYDATSPSGASAGTQQGSRGFESGTATTQTFGQSETDRTLSTQVQQSFYRDTTLATMAPRIQVSAQNGTVTLSGTVSSEQEKQKFETLAKSTNGVVTVNNQLQVSLQPTSEREGTSSRLYQEPTPSSTTTTEPARTDTTSPQSNNPTDQSRTDTSSTQSAQADTATTESAKSQTDQSQTPQSTSESSSTGVSATSQRPESGSRIYSSSTNQFSTTNQFGTNQLGATGSTGFDLNVQGLSEADKSLGQKIMQELKADTDLAAQLSMIKLNVESGKVTLRGTVKSEDQKSKIETAVQRVTGVSNIDNQLQVSAISPSTGELVPNK